MVKFGKTSTKPNYLFGQLPRYYKQQDTYKDSNDEGFLERYLEVFCQEIDNELIDYIDEVLILFEPLGYGDLSISNANDFLIHLAETFGNPPDIGTTDQYKALISYILHILGKKGTQESMELYLNLLGYTINSINSETVSGNTYDSSPVLQYDKGGQYDSGFTFYSGFNIEITDYPGTGTKSPSSTWLDSLKEALQKFICPIWAEIGTLTYV